MSVAAPSYGAPVPSVDKSLDSLLAGVLALKQNVEILQGTRRIDRPDLGFVTTVRTQIGAALSRVRRG